MIAQWRQEHVNVIIQHHKGNDSVPNSVKVADSINHNRSFMWFEVWSSRPEAPSHKVSSARLSPVGQSTAFDGHLL